MNEERILRIPVNFKETHVKEMAEVCVEFKDELALISDEELKEKVIMVMADILHDAPVEHYYDIPFGFDAGDFYNMQTHVQQVTHMAVAFADSLKKYGHIDCERDILVAACLLHDGSKILECDKGHNRTELGSTLIHSQVAGVRCWDFGLPAKVCYIASYHTFTPPHVHINPKCIEFILLTYADIGSADPIFFAHGKPCHLQISKRFFEVQ